MKLDDILRELEQKTSYQFERTKNILGDDVLSLVGLPKKCEIHISINKSYNGVDYISLSGQDKCGSYSGFGNPCDNISELVERLDDWAKRYGHKNTGKQLSFLGG